MKALFVGLDARAGRTLALSLRVRWPDVRVATAETGRRGLQDLSELPPDLIISAPELADMDVLDFIEKTRFASDAVVIALVTQDDDSELVAALEAGADDCFPVSSNGTRFIARVGAAMRRARRLHEAGEPPLMCGNLEINPASFAVYVDGQHLHLTPIEFKLLYHLAKSIGRVVTQHTLESIIWGLKDNFSADSLRQSIRRLRQKLGTFPDARAEIVTLPRIGYKLIELPLAEPA